MRALRWVIGIALALVVVFHVAGGWYFADVLKHDALDARRDPPTRDLKVVKVSGDQITVKDPEPPSLELRSDADFALEWASGFGRITGAAEVEGDLVTRTWEPLVGTAKPGQSVGVDQDDVVGESLPTGQKLVEYSDALGAFDAWLRPGPSGQNTTWAVLVHGKGAHPAEMQRMARVMHERGLPTLSLFYRNDPGQPRDRSGEYGFGATEWRDLRAAVEFARQHGATDFVLGGNSMGGAIVASYLRNAKPDDVRGVVLDAPMLDFEQTIDYGATQRTVPGTPIALPASLTWTAKRLATLRFGVDWDAWDYLSDPSWVREPLLIVHGDADLTVPISTSRSLARAVSGKVRLVEFPDAGHCQSWNFDPAKYDATVGEFVDQVI